MFASRAIGITFILALTALFAPGQTPTPPAGNPEPPKTGTITGQVVDESGQPLKDVVVQLRALRANVSQTVNSDREGQFQFTGLEPADYNLDVRKPAYQADRSKPLTRPYRIGDRVTLTMIKGGVVTGKVLNANGEPVVMVNVRAQMVRTPDGQTMSGYYLPSRSTDDRGIYRIYGLPAGTYVIVAGGPDQFSRVAGEAVFQFDVPTYAPSSTRETAAEISVRTGEEVSDVDIRYRGEQGRVISGEVTVPAPAHRGFSVVLTAGGEAESQYGETFYQTENKRTFMFKGVADGDYSVIAQSYAPDGEMAISEAKQISVQGTDVTGIQLATKLLGSVSGRLVLEETKLPECKDDDHPLATETLIFARYKDDDAAKEIPRIIRSRTEPARPDEKGNFLLRNLPPGAYHFVPTLRARQWYVNSITFGPVTETTAKARQIDAARVWTNVKNGDRLSGLTIAMVHGAALLRGQYELAQEEWLPSGSVLYLVPAEREKANDVWRFFVTPIARNGVFELTNIAPGRYLVLAQVAGEDASGASARLRLPLETGLRAQLRRAAEATKTELELKPCQDVTNLRLPIKPQN